ncbi:MAG: hypothetical protein U1E83_01425 [Methylotetracoccus sp.]
MEPVNDVLTTLFGIVMIAAVGFELRRRRRQLRELYNVLDAEDGEIVAELDRMAASGTLQPYTAA